MPSLAQLEAELAALQGEKGMMRVSVDAQIVGEVISAWTGNSSRQDGAQRDRNRAHAR